MMEVVYRLDREGGGITKTCAEGIISADFTTFRASGGHEEEQHLRANAENYRNFRSSDFRPSQGLVGWLVSGIWKGGLSEPLFLEAAFAATSRAVRSSTTSARACLCASAVRKWFQPFQASKQFPPSCQED